MKEDELAACCSECQKPIKLNADNVRSSGLTDEQANRVNHDQGRCAVSSAPKVGDMVYVSLAYDMDTRAQTKRDEYAEQIGEVQELAENDALVFTPATSKEAWISRSRLSPARWYRICSCCGSAEYVSKPQDPERDRGYGTCDRCRPVIIADMVKCGFAGRQYTEEQAAERMARYA